MHIGIPAERHPLEYRVGLTAQGVGLLTQAGHTVYIETDAGQAAGYTDEDYERAGGRIAYNTSEIYGRGDLILKVGSPVREEQDMLRDGQTICAFWHLPARPRELLYTILDRNITAIAYELIAEADGTMPVLQPLSAIGGRMVPQIAAQLLQTNNGGRGELMGGIAGIPPLDIVIIGAGTAGTNAAQTFMGMGARVLMLDTNLQQLQAVDRYFKGRVATMLAHEPNIARVMTFADVLVGAVLVPGARAPVVVTREMVRSMRPGAIIIDLSIDQGGCLETSRPTTHDNPTFVEEGVLHYCVPNMTAVVARTATRAYIDAAWPYIKQITEGGTDAALADSHALQRSAVVAGGEIHDPRLAKLIEEVSE